MIIIEAQRPRIYQGLGVIDLNLMAFAKIYERIYIAGRNLNEMFSVHFLGDENRSQLLSDVQKSCQIIWGDCHVAGNQRSLRICMLPDMNLESCTKTLAQKMEFNKITIHSYSQFLTSNCFLLTFSNS